MTDNPGPPEDAARQAKYELVRLESQVAAMRAVLVQLLQDVVRADSRLDKDEAARLQEANEQLVLSALDAMSEADTAQVELETAQGALDEASRVGGLDSLTGLLNRTRLLDRFETAIFNARRHGTRVALLFLDLDAFKCINDGFGHATGDVALQTVAGVLSSLVREMDTVSRHGGDEFVILLAEVAHADDAEVVAEKVLEALSAVVTIDQHPVQLNASIGISVYPEDGVDTKTLIDHADAAMYRAKNLGPGGFMFHDGHAPPRSATVAAGVRSMHRRFTHDESAMAEHDRQHETLREANEQLVLAALGAQELLAAAQASGRRQAELLALVAEELSNPFAPIRLAASTLGIPGAEATLLPRVQAVIEEQADKMLRMVKAALAQPCNDHRPDSNDPSTENPP
ncbi:hypothetical protein BH11PSE8_BH11PSE8_30610 [soil metagenome]